MEFIKEAIRALLANKSRTFLSMLGIIIGVMAVIAVLAVGEGSTKSITQRVSSLGSNLIMIRAGTSGGSSGRVSVALSDVLKMQHVEDILAMCPSVKNALGAIESRQLFTYEKKNSNVSVIGSNNNIFKILELPFAQGRQFSNEEEAAYEKVVVIGNDVATTLFGTESPLGKSINLTVTANNIRYAFPMTIIGVLEKTGSKLMYNPDKTVFMPYLTAEGRLYHRQGKIDTIIASAIDSETSPKAYYEIEALLFSSLKSETKYSLVSQDEILSRLGEITGILNIFLGAIAGISLLVGGIGIMNIMLVTVTERTKEIGIKKAIGATRRVILLEFLVESIFITFIAGLIGIILGILLSKGVEIIAKTYNLIPQVTFQSIVLSFCASVVIGLFFGIYPASKASKLSPVEALRNE